MFLTRFIELIKIHFVSSLHYSQIIILRITKINRVDERLHTVSRRKRGMYY
jgi:hypothetical protein